MSIRDKRNYHRPLHKPTKPEEKPLYDGHDKIECISDTHIYKNSLRNRKTTNKEACLDKDFYKVLPKYQRDYDIDQVECYILKNGVDCDKTVDFRHGDLIIKTYKGEIVGVYFDLRR